MPSDRTRASHELLQRYKAVVMQQGRVILDRDFNALQEIVDGLLEANVLEAIGPCGTPYDDGGFAISVPTAGPSASFAPSASLPASDDFLIAPGTIYVGGQRIVLPAPGLNKPSWSYHVQPPDWEPPIPPTPFSGPHSSPLRDFVYLHVFEQEVSAVEDPDLLDVALGGADTTQRVRLMVRIHRMWVSATDPATALAAAMVDLGAHGLKLDASMQLKQQVQILVSAVSTSASSSPCDPIIQGGYLGTENQLIRVQIANDPATNTPQLIWGYDNASFLYRARILAAQDGVGNPQAKTTTLQLLQSPVDAYRAPQAGQVVEVLRTTAILGNQEQANLPAGKKTLVPCVAERTGFVTTVATPYNSGDNTVVLNGTLPTSYSQAANPLFLRVWQGQQLNLNQSLSQPISLIDSVTNLPLGVQVTLTVPPGGPADATLPTGAFWMIAVRPGTPQVVYPERFLTDPQWPDGPRNWICPLALINWLGQGSFSGPGFSPPAIPVDCRQPFANLVELTSRAWGDQVNVCGVTTLGSPGIVIYNGTVTPGTSIGLNDLQQGLQIILNQNIEPASATLAACFVTLDLPFQPVNASGNIGYQSLVLGASVTSRDPTTLVWSPSFNFWANLNKFITGLGLGSFAQDWTSVPLTLPGDLSWAYTQQGHAQLHGSVPVSSSQTTSVTFSEQVTDPRVAVTSLSAAVQFGAESAGTFTVETGVAFNRDPSGGFWLFGLSPFPAHSGTTSAVLVHYNSSGSPGQPLTAPVPLPDNVQNVTFEIFQSPGSTSLSFNLTFPGKSLPVTFTPTTLTKPPPSILPSTNVGLYISFSALVTATVNLDCSSLSIGYVGGATEVILPANFLLPLTLTVKRNFLQPASGEGNPAHRPRTFAAPCPDFSVGFWLVPPGFAAQSFQGSVPFSSRP